MLSFVEVVGGLLLLALATDYLVRIHARSRRALVPVRVQSQRDRLDALEDER